ncbi:hypothetical protein [Sorangium sp. So ce1389]|uniref:hypothetical protein n=1 Tax=Sorangium sp. So ce1389 TaxID=3133336 RepID=UPI003F5D7660
MPSPMTPSRRALLARLGALGAALCSSALLLPSCAEPPPPEPETGAGSSALLLDDIRAVLAEIARDTLNGLTTFVVPGGDAYSRAQGTLHSQPGALEADTTDFLMETLDRFVAFPDQVARPVGAALATALAGSGFRLPLTLGSLLGGLLFTVDGALRRLLENDESIPLSVAMAMLLNVAALQINPLSVNGPFLSPFARLSFADKAKVFRALEGPDAALVALLDGGLPQPLRASVSGLLRFVSGALLELSAFGAYGEWAVFDEHTRTLSARPIGWQLTGYQPDGPVEGWDDLLGYYQGRTGAED